MIIHTQVFYTMLFFRIDGTEDGCYSWLVYGGLGLLCAPLNDAWILKVDKKTLSSADWTQMDLEYDHGEVRCWHGSCKVGLVLIALSHSHFMCWA